MAREPLEQLAEAGSQLISEVFRGGRLLFRWGQARRERERAKRKAQEDARASKEKQQKWHNEVERQQARGTSGFAAETEAQTALRGKGGRQSSLDDRWF
jgi:hypothetical protein